MAVVVTLLQRGLLHLQIAVAVVRGLRSQAQYFGEIANTPAEIKKLVKRLSPEGEVMNFCYEAGACGYEVYH